MAARERLICAAEALAEADEGVRFETRYRGASVPALVIRFRGQARAYLNRCGHIPVELDWQPGEFFDHSRLYLVCATHGALYDPETGACLGGRCNGRELIALPISERDGQIYLKES